MQLESGWQPHSNDTHSHLVWAIAGNQELVRGCITAVPCRQKGDVHVKVLSEESVWGEGVL